MEAENPPSAPDKEGFIVPWSVTVDFDVIEDDVLWCCNKSVTVKISFICPSAGTGKAVPGVTLHGSPSIEHWLGVDSASLEGATYSECCSSLGIFRRAFCYVTFVVPWTQLLIQQPPHFIHHWELPWWLPRRFPSPVIPDFISPTKGNFAFIASDGRVYANPSTFAEKLAKFPTACSNMFGVKEVGVTRTKAEVLSFLALVHADVIPYQGEWAI